MRDLDRLRDERFDLLVVGAGAFGAFAAWDAALRGLRVALVDGGDYCGGVSSRCFRIVHGGIRYLQHFDIGRVRRSARERAILLETAPHMVEPLPILVPTYGLARDSRWFLGAGSLAYDALTWDRNRRISRAERRVPMTRFVGSDETLEAFPFLAASRPTGAVEFCDGHMHSPARLVLAAVRSAVELGAAAANHCAARRLLVQEGRAVGAEARDTLTGEQFEIRADCVLNATGPAAAFLLERSGLSSGATTGPFSRDACLVVDRPAPPRALAFQGQGRDLDSRVGREKRHLFLVPWKGRTLVGVWHRVYPTATEDIGIGWNEVEAWLDEVNRGCPGLDLRPDEVVGWDYGLVPFGQSDPDSRDLHFGHESVFLDHARLDGVGRLLSLIGIRYTMGRADGARAVDWALGQLGREPTVTRSDTTPLFGGDIPDLEALEARIADRAHPLGLAHRARRLMRDHGTAFGEVLSLVEDDPALAAACGEAEITEAEVVHAVRDEAARSLLDVLIRRTDLGVAGAPAPATVAACARVMARELGWSREATDREIAAARGWYPRPGPATAPDPQVEVPPLAASARLS